ncbi:MAG: LptF/LptG family permease [Arcobacteraceae bacterium]|nr:LptF/LptG family permease [Arcobacteraceae bacterium]MDY0327012.1 LptF/LptG family permease [Arcobacteraceae bacterium]
MNKLKTYLYDQLSSSFFQIFFILFAITSIIYLVRIAALTSIIEVSASELLLLYTYSIPNILFYTIPIVFFVALAISISRLSTEYETIVITSFGLNPYQIIQIFLPVTVLVSITLLIISLGLIPKTKDLNRVFIETKKDEAKLNIKASQNGQKFGDWLIYIQNEQDETFYDVTMFRNTKDSKEFITSDSADTTSLQSELLFKLYNGKAFIVKDDINQINFEQLTLVNSTNSKSISDEFTNPIDYWNAMNGENKKTKDFAMSFLISIFPLISMFMIVYIGYYNPRYEKNNAVALTTFFITIYIIAVIIFNKYIPLYSIAIIPILWTALGYVLFRKNILCRY